MGKGDNIKLPSASLEVEISSDLTQVSKVRKFVRAVALEYMQPILNNESINELILAVHEAITNIIKYSYKGRVGQPILIEAHPSDGRLTILLNHWGQHFDPGPADPPAFDDPQDTGFGLFIIENCVDEVTYGRSQNGKCTISLAKSCVALKGKLPMNLDVENIDDIVVITLPGKTLEASNAQEFSDGVAPLIQDNKKMMFDLSQLNFIDSTGCRAILMCYKNLQKKGGTLHLCCASGRINALFRLMNLSELLGIYENSEDAVKAFREIGEKA